MNSERSRYPTSPNRSVVLEWATFLMATIAAVGSLVRLAPVAPPKVT